ncbi:hypothetical protein C8R47DRAFT_1221965 [Mycena vitilis]|nr:hypothetical protein C8R47DRAFT_1085083 [Mycena vitilis]KAJ6472205.1 hypothetical protein C8R47DRAFT_1221965 [Mycena vitilis]
MDRADGIPMAPILPSVPLPQMRAAAPRHLLPAPSAPPPHFAHPAASPFTTTPLDAVLRGSTFPPSPATSPFTLTPLGAVARVRRVQRGKGILVGRNPRRARFFLTHPPNEPLKCDTRAMVRFGTDAEAGHHVLKPIRTRKGKGKCPDIPAPPVRLLTYRPALLEDAESSPDQYPSYVLNPHFAHSLHDTSSASVSREESAACVDERELDAQIHRIARLPSTLEHHNWPLTAGWTRSHASFVSNVRSAEHGDALAFIRAAIALTERSPHVLDFAGMQLNAMVDLDLPQGSDDDPISSDQCTHFTERVQSIRDTLAAHSPGRSNDGHTSQNITSVPVPLDGHRHRLFSHHALTQPFAYRYIIDILARHHPDWIEFYTLLRSKILGVNRYLEDLFKRRGWFLDEALLHQLAPPLPPYLKPSEYSRLRLFKYTFELQGYPDVASVIDTLLHFRFQEPEVVAHFLHAGMLDPCDLHLSGTGGAKFITRRLAPESYRASRARSLSFRDANLSLQKRHRVDLRSRAKRERTAQQ